MEIATKGQLRWAFLRWAMVTVPLIILLGFASSQVAPAGEHNLWYMALAKPALASRCPMRWLARTEVYRQRITCNVIRPRNPRLFFWC